MYKPLVDLQYKSVAGFHVMSHFVKISDEQYDGISII